MCVYWRGLPPNKDWLRVDAEAHFEAIPRQHMSDIIGVKKRGHSDKTLEFVKKKSLDTVLHSHDLDDAKHLENHVKPIIHAIVDKPEIVNSVPSTNSHWYDGIV